MVPNHLNPDASWSFSDGQGCLFETYDVELNFIRSQPPEHVWTLIDGDDGDLSLVSGVHFVNRIGYFLTLQAVPDDTDLEVRFPMGDEN